MRWIGLVLWIALCFAAAGMGARWTTPEITDWYATLKRPSFAPPNRVFGPVWSLLYALMAIAAWRVWLAAPSSARSWALGLFLAQLALNLAWSWIFFRKHAIGAALAEVVTLWVAIGAAVFTFAPISSAAEWLMAPYWAWVTFATALNAAFWRLNRTAQTGARRIL